MVLLISGPSGVGKGTLIKNLRLVDPRWHLARSITTRAPRPNDGDSYNFVTHQEFRDAIKAGKMAEWEEYGSNLYGTPYSELSHPYTIIECDVRGHRALRQNIDLHSVFLMPPSLTELEARLRGRGTENEDGIQARLKQAQSEIDVAGEYEYTVIMDTREGTLAQLLDIITEIPV